MHYRDADATNGPGVDRDQNGTATRSRGASHSLLFIYSGVFLCSWVLLILGLDRSALNVYDEGDVLVGAQRVFWGEVPYRDFWTLYGPAQYWIVAALFDLFEPSILVERIWDTFVRAGIATAGYAMSRELSGRKMAFAVWVLSLGWLWIVRFYGYPLLPAALFGMLSIYFLLRYVGERNGPWALVFAGALGALAGAFRYDIAVYALVASATTILCGPYLLPDIAPRRARAWRTRVIAVALVGSGALVVAVPVAIYLFLMVPVGDVLDPLVVYVGKYYVAMRSLPFPSLPHYSLASGRLAESLRETIGTLAFYFPCLAAGAGAIYLWRLRKNTSDDINSAKCFSILLLVILVLLFYVKALVRPHAVHVIHALVPAFVLAGVLLSTFARFGLAHGVLGGIILLLLAGPPAATAYREVKKVLRGITVGFGAGADELRTNDLHSYLLREGNGPAPARYFMINRSQAAAVAYIAQHTTADDRLLIANGRHDVAFANDMLFYFLAQRRPATKYHEFNPGLTTRADVQAAIIASVEGARVPYVVRLRVFDNPREPNKSAESSGVFLLDRFLVREYAEVARFGEYEIWRKRE